MVTMRYINLVACLSPIVRIGLNWDITQMTILH